MRKSGWMVAAGVGSLLLLAGCGGSSSSSAAGANSSTATQTQSTASTATSAASSTGATSTGSASARSTSSSQSAKAQPSSNTDVTFPPVGTTVLIVQRSAIGWVMARADGYVVYTYSKDTKGGAPTCTGSCAAAWSPVTGVPKAGPSDTFPGSFAVVSGSNGAKVISYNGYPLYTLVGAPPLTTKGDGVGGVWHVIKLSESDISS
jgi:predicted lipoprotein with Yx(FWY)xxD motif